MEECVFCKIAEGNISANKIYENENFYSIPDVNPVGEGHTLIIPKKHFGLLTELDDETSQQYISVIKEVGKILMKKYNADGFNILLNNGESAGQIIKHVHFHMLPRKKGDNKRGIFIG